MWKLYALLSALFAAITAILAKAGVKNIDSNLATAVRTVVILFMAWGIVLFTGQFKQLATLSKTNILILSLSGIATGLSWLFYFKALQTGNVSKVAPIDKLSVAIAIGLSFIILKEPVDTKVIIGALLITAGTIIIII